MAYDEQVAEEQQQVAEVQETGGLIMPGTDPNDPLTYDPTQGRGTLAWQQAVAKQMRHNAQQRRN